MGHELFPKLPLHMSLDEPPRSIIAIVDLESEMSIRNNYLKLNDLHVEIEPDSDEETNEQVHNAYIIMYGAPHEIDHALNCLSL